MMKTCRLAVEARRLKNACLVAGVNQDRDPRFVNSMARSQGPTLLEFPHIDRAHLGK